VGATLLTVGVDRWTLRLSSAPVPPSGALRISAVRTVRQ